MWRITFKGLEGSLIDSRSLRLYIETAVGNELAGLAQDCYLPRISTLYKELLHRTNSDEKELLAYSKKKYNKHKYKLLHDPFTTLLILITQHFLRETKDMAAALYTFNLHALRTYTNVSFKFIPQGCNDDYFKVALEKLSSSHIFRQKDTIGNSVMYFSRAVFDKYKKDLEKDNADRLWKMIYEIRTRINQSCRSFYGHYYKAKEDKEKMKSRGEEDIYEKETLEQKKHQFADKLSKDITVYHKVDRKATEDSRRITKFSRVYSEKFSKIIGNPEYQEMINVLYILMLRPIDKLDMVCSTKFLDYIKAMMSIKTSNKPVYFKKNLIELHDQYVIPALELDDWFNHLSVQTKKISRDFLAYYLALFMRNYIC